MTTETINIFRTSEHRVEFGAGSSIFSRGEESDFMYAVLEGEVEISVNDTAVETVGPGGVVGEMALIRRGAPRTADVTAKSDVVLVPIDETEFTRYVHNTPLFALTMLRIVSERLSRTNELL